jgi:hypothetical protein
VARFSKPPIVDAAAHEEPRSLQEGPAMDSHEVEMRMSCAIELSLSCDEIDRFASMDD